MNQVSRNAKHRLNKGLVTFSALVKPTAKELFSEIRKHNHITTAELFEQMIEAYQKQDKENVTILSEDHFRDAGNQPAPTATGNSQSINLSMSMVVEDRKTFALDLFQQHGKDKRLTMATLKSMLQEQYPGFSANREVNMVGEFSEAMRFYSYISDFLGRFIKSGQRP